MEGWIKLYRNLLNSFIFENEKLLKVFIWCLLKATHKEREVLVGRQLVKLKPGQFVFGRNKAALELKLKPTTLWAYILTLKNKESIDIISNNKYSIITIVNWWLYQSEEEKTDNNIDNKRTTNGQQTDTNKNIKKDKNNNIYTPEFEKFWNIYPRKVGKQAAFKNWKTRTKDDATPDQLILAAQNYADECERKGTDEQYIKHPSTFLGPTKPYEDYLKKPAPKKSYVDDYMEEAFRRRMMQNANTTP